MITKPDRKFLRELQKRYRKTSKLERMIILNEFTKTTGYDRQYAGKLLRGRYIYVAKRVHRPHRIYTKEDADILEKAYQLLGWVCSKRMKPTLRLAVDELIKAGKVTLSKEDRKRIIAVSPATIDRLFKKHKKRSKLKGRSYTKPGTLLKTQIPIRTFSEWNENKVGFFEIDLVGHDGSLVKGDFAWTLNFVDVKTAWTEQAAVFGSVPGHGIHSNHQVE